MESFLSEVAQKLLTQYSVQELKDIAVIVPSRRAGLHFKTELAKQIKQTFWAPQIQSLDDYIIDLHELTPIDPISVHFELFSCYCQLFEEPGSFDVFHSWSSQVLSDFNEIDRYLLPSELVFKNLKDIKEIEAWSFNADELSAGQEKFLEFWEKLGELYLLFNSKLEKKGFSTKGRIYKDVANNPEKYLKNIPQKEIIFIGFNALSKSEETIFAWLKNLGKAEVFWDVDQYYMNDNIQEAGNFVRQYKKWNEENFKKIPNNITKEKTVTIYPANTNLNQINIAAQILSSNPQFGDTKSAVILSDEQLLKPFLNTIPIGIDKMNITMGYSFSNTLSLELLDIIFTIQINSKRFQSNQNKNTIYFKDLFTFLEHVLVIKFFKNKGIDAVQIIDHFTKNNFSFITKKNLEEVFGTNAGLLDILFYHSAINIESTILQLASFCDKLRLTLIDEANKTFEIEVLYKIIFNLKKIESINTEYPYIEDIEGIRNLFNLINKSEKLSFYGEPLEGLQVMGLLESRAIDFDNIILVSCNEKFLPGVQGSNSFIPHDLKIYLGLPTKQDREAIFSYYFYRLLNRVKNIHLIYNNGLPNGLDSNEISRYLIQIESELPHQIARKDYNFKWNNKSVPNEIKKDSSTLKKIDLLFENGLSPSALNTYLSCPLDFYYKYALRINEKQELEETIENSTQGTIIHEVLEELYKEHSPTITESSVNAMLNKYEALTDKLYLKQFPSKSYRFGKNLLYYKMALKEIKLFLTQEKKQIQKKGPIEILGLEEPLDTRIEIETSQGRKTIFLKGKADRIDVQNGQIRIIDYKSGFVKPEEVSVSSIEQVFEKPKAAQLLFYGYLYNKKNPNSGAISGIISMRNLKQNLIPFSLKEKKGEENISEEELYSGFEEILISKIQEIYSVSILFTHDSKAKYCMLCE